MPPTKFRRLTMQVALYGHYNSLPFWGKPENPHGMFSVSHSGNTPSAKKDDAPLDKTWGWPLLVGLSQVDMHLMAHVSVGLYDGKLHDTPRLHIHISTMPTQFDKEGVPVIVANGKRGVDVVEIWSSPSDDRSPLNWPEVKAASEDDVKSSNFWCDLFIQYLRREKAGQMEKARVMALQALDITRIFAAIM